MLFKALELSEKVCVEIFKLFQRMILNLDH